MIGRGSMPPGRIRGPQDEPFDTIVILLAVVGCLGLIIGAALVN